MSYAIKKLKYNCNIYGTVLIDFIFRFHFHLGIEKKLEDLPVGDCDHILQILSICL